MDHHITVCTSCRHTGTACYPGYEVIKRLRAALAVAEPAVAQDFAISGVACMAGCDRPCTVAYHGSQKATYLFGDIDPDADIDDLMTFAQDYAASDDGWCAATQRPGKLATTTLARVPAAMIVTEQTQRRVS